MYLKQKCIINGQKNVGIATRYRNMSQYRLHTDQWNNAFEDPNYHEWPK